jgi:hypothetical protein
VVAVRHHPRGGRMRRKNPALQCFQLVTIFYRISTIKCTNQTPSPKAEMINSFSRNSNPELRHCAICSCGLFSLSPTQSKSMKSFCK